MTELQPTSRSSYTPPVDADNPRERRKQRGDLWYFETTPAPRPDDLCERYAARVAPWWGFAVYALAYLFVGLFAFTAGIFLAIGVKELLGVRDGSTLATVLAYTFGFAAFALSWWPFARWVKRRRGAAMPLIRDGKLIDGVVLDKFSGRALDVVGRVATDYAMSQVGGIKFFRVAIDSAGEEHVLKIPITTWRVPPPGTMLKVLFNPAATYALVFHETGKAQVAKVG